MCGRPSGHPQRARRRILHRRPAAPKLARMDEDEKLKRHWAQMLDRVGAAGRAWRKSLVFRAAERIPDTEVCAADPLALKAAIKDMRRARASGHWSFRPERLRTLYALYLRVRAAGRLTAPAPPDTRPRH